ncbi:N-acetyllactosaminide beta-1,3-N-acetylglucosaminyltransferase 4 [Frankliniella fusca]|uniref:N-acetyllactosaminide beta-1,3-N-acetylglucosaminyltransferase 4 n=1 Tax=Frankliniella fusca TaxID=407009 RepID=A0AAE1LFL4_9NEOP|nr:N-acetyllactosaminide beta-1,3-N-acetylglucosaminyltransferase 4 [Frankliniella fusca]
MPYNRYNWQRNEVGFVKNETVERQEVKSELSDSESIASSSSIVKSFNTSCCVQSPEESAATGGSSRLKQVNVVDKSNVAGSSKEAAFDLLPTNTCESDQLDFNGDLFSLVIKIIEMGAVIVYLCTLPLLPGSYHDSIMAFNKAVAGFSEFGNAVHVVDFEKIFLKSGGKIDVNFYERCYKSNKIDIHPNGKGFKLMYAKLCDNLQAK